MQELFMQGSGPFSSPVVTRVIGITPDGTTQCVLELELEDGARLHLPILHRAARALHKMLLVHVSRTPEPSDPA